MATPVQEERFEYKGFPCVVLFMPMGFRNGYVGLPQENKYYGKGYDFMPVNCHCGLTYASRNLYGQEDKNTWWIGFDCGHCCDGFDIEAIKEHYKDDAEALKQLKTMQGYYSMVNSDTEFRTLDYVKEECKKIVDQLLEESEE